MEIVDNMTYLDKSNTNAASGMHVLNSREAVLYTLNISTQVLILNIFNVITNTCFPAAEFL